MKSLFSSEHEDSISGHYRLWLHRGIVFAALGYAAVALLVPPITLASSEGAIALFCLALLVVHRRHPRLAGFLVVSVVWVELMWSMSTSLSGVRDPSGLVFPVWLVAVALFFGTRMAWVMMVLTGAAVAWAGLGLNPAITGRPFADDDFGFFLVLEICILGAPSLVNVFMGTLGVALRRERVQAARASRLVEEAPDAMIAVNAGHVVAFNSLAESYFGQSRAETIGQKVLELPFWGEALPFVREGIEEASPEEFSVLNRTLEMRVRRLDSDGGRPVQLLVFRDISQRIAAESRSRELQVQLEHSQRLEAIGQLAGGIAHDFNNLLTAFSGSAELLCDSSDPMARKLATGLLSASERGAALTRQLLTFARRDVAQATTFDVSEAIAGSQGLIKHMLGERVELILDLEERCFIRADRGQVEQAVLNLAANARDAIQGGGSFELSTGRDEEQVWLSARDSGAGMDAATCARVFEPFYTTKERNKGTGLGLATVHGIVQRWGGRISVESQLGKGARFLIHLPLAEGQLSESDGSVRASRMPTLTGHILFVEDDETARGVSERLLLRSGLQVTTAANAEEALALCRDGLKPDMLLSDVIMPGMTGVELAERLRRERPELPVLFISGYVDDVLRDWPFDTTSDLLLKPFSVEALLMRLRKKLRERPSA